MTRSRCRRRLERIERPNIIHHQALTGLQWMASQSVLHTWHTDCAGYGCVRRREAPLKRNALVVADGQNDSYRCCGGRTIPIAALFCGCGENTTRSAGAANHVRNIFAIIIYE